MARVQTQLSLRRSVSRVLALERGLSERNAELESANTQLKEWADRTNRDIQLAARIQATYLPREESPNLNGVEFGWRYEPSAELAGDALNMFALGDRHVGFYVFDVSGHGVAASLTAVSAARIMSSPNDPDSILCDRVDGGRPLPPARVLALLNERFVFNADTGQFLTCFYGVLDTTTRELRYASAGHPGPIWVRRDGAALTLETTGAPIGVGEQYDEVTVTLAAGDRLFAYSDGIVESRDPDGEFFGMDRMSALAAGVAALSLRDAVAKVERDLATFRGGKPAGDDISLLALECG
jgi:sigma-B regulation protein RsbU (phosphoserine phosphatase)